MTKIFCFSIILSLVLLSLSCKEIQGPAGPQGPAGDATGSLTDPSIMPKVIYTYPPANTLGPYDDFYVPAVNSATLYSQFQLRFNKIMDRSSIRRSIAIWSSLGDVHVDTNFVISTGGDVYLINPVDSLGIRFDRWKIGQNYNFSLSTSAKDVNGNFFQSPFVMSFEPEPYFRVRTIKPVNGASYVSVNALINILLNSPVDTSLFSSIQINPDIPGRWYFTGDSSRIYHANETLLNNTTYTVTIAAGAHDKHGNPLPQTFMSSFTTVPFRVDRTYPVNGATNVSLNQYMEVDFSSPIDTGTVRTAFRIIPQVNGSLYAYDGSSYFNFSHDDFLPETTYTVTVDSSVRSKRGQRLSDPYTFSFRTAPFQVVNSDPVDGSVDVNRFNTIYVYFNASIDTGTIHSSFSIKDSNNVDVAGDVYSYDGSSYIYFYPPSGFAPNAKYTGTVSTAIRSKSGYSLKAPFRFSFTTGN